MTAMLAVTDRQQAEADLLATIEQTEQAQAEFAEAIEIVAQAQANRDRSEVNMQEARRAEGEARLRLTELLSTIRRQP